jgi:hypothetical protein
MTSATDFLMGPAEDETPPSGPYGTGVPVYARLEYTGMVPVRTQGDKAKTIAIRKVSGRKGIQTPARLYAGPNALPKFKDFNIGWRLPYGVIGIDIDQYDDKHGADDLKELENDLGPLPSTWSSTARGDGPSRIYFFRVPEDCGELRGSLSESIEVIQHHHRYAMVWPSVHAKTGNTYAWYNGVRSDTPPRLDLIADLPATWLEHLSKPQRGYHEGAGLGVKEFRQRYTGESDPDLVQRILDRFDTRDGCRHDSMLKALGWACRESTYGKVAAGPLFDALEDAWWAAKPEAGPDEFSGSHSSLLETAVRDTPEPDEDVKDDEYEDEEEQDTGEPTFGPEVHREVRVEALRILRREKAMEIVRNHKAKQRTSGNLTVGDALDALLGGAQLDVPSVGVIEGNDKGWGLFYPGHVNGIFGDGSVGKTVILAELQARELNAGGTVIHWEFDNNPIMSIVKRLIDADAEPDGIRNRLHVLYDKSGRDVLPAAVRQAAKLVTLDALNPAVTSFDLDPYHPGGIDTVIQECFQPFTLNGACGLFLDHVGHENKERQHGSIRKAQAVQGALYEACKVVTLKPGTTGRTRLVLRKDNRGSLGNLDGRTLAVAVMTSQVDAGGLAGRVDTAFCEPDPFSDEPTWVTEDSRTPETNVERIIREMDQRGLPMSLAQRPAREWLKDNGGPITGKGVDWQNAHAARQARGRTDPDQAPAGFE